MALPYATLVNVKSRLGIPTVVTEDVRLGMICDQVNAYIESITGRAIGSNSVDDQLIDGWDAIEDGSVLLYKDGIRNLRALAVAPTTGGTFVAVASNDAFIRPTAYKRQPGWPAFEIVFTDIPSDSTQYPYFPPGFANVKLSADIGWAAMPEELREIAEVTVVRAWQARQAGQSDMTGSDEVGQPMVSNYLSARDRATLMRYRWRAVEVI